MTTSQSKLPSKKVLLLLAEGFEIYEASVFIDVFGWNLTDGDGSTRLFSCGLRKQLNSSFGQGFIVDLIASEINPDDFDALAIPGGFEEYGFYTDAYDENFLEVIRKFNTAGKPIASVCTGALPVGKSGILHGRRATTYNRNPKRQDILRSFGIEVVNEPIVEDGNIITSFNPSTAINVALSLLSKLTSPAQAAEIRYLMGFSESR